MTDPRNVAIFIFTDVEVLDFAGPFEVFNVAGEQVDPRPFNTYTVAQTSAPVKARGDLTIVPHYSIQDMPKPDVLLIPGGKGTRPLLHERDIIDWIKAQHAEVERLLSVCTGALLLGKAGLLDGLEATTHHGSFDLLRQLSPTTTVHENKRYVDNGKIVTSGGISAGIDMALHIVNQLAGADAVKTVTKEMEYTWAPLETE
jgi:transcriptional regulator GlxA family with amidase domain